MKTRLLPFPVLILLLLHTLLCAQPAVLPEPRLETLEAAWSIALAVDQRLQAAHWTTSSAEQDYLAARAEYLPLGTLEGAYTVRDNDPSFVINSPLLPSVFANPYHQREDFSFQGRVSLPVYTSGRISNAIDAASHSVAAARHQLAIDVLDVKLQVAYAYIDVLRAERDLSVADGHVASLESHAHDIEMLYRNEQVPRNDLLAAQVSLADGQHGRIRAENVLDGARAAYNRRLGRPLDADVRLAAIEVPAVSDDLRALTAQALAQRPELARLREQMAALNHQANSILASRRAQVHVDGAYTFQENRFQSPQGITSAALAISWNVFDGGRTDHRAQALAHQAQSLARLTDDLASRIELEARRVWLDVNETRRRLAVTSDAIRRADENLRVTRGRYKMGVATNTDVLSAEALRFQALRNHSAAEYDAVLAAIYLQRVIGQL